MSFIVFLFEWGYLNEVLEVNIVGWRHKMYIAYRWYCREIDNSSTTAKTQPPQHMLWVACHLLWSLKLLYG